MRMKRAVYAGSFDPITNGHFWMIEQGAKLFDHLIVAIGDNPEKAYTFSFDDRIRILKESVVGIRNVSIAGFENKFLVDYASSEKCGYILRGIRDSDDFIFERKMRHINQDIQSEIATVFLMPPRNIAEISSSFVKGLVGPSGWRKVVEKYV